MSEQRFDPMTGKPINPDTVNQQPVNQQPVNQQPVNQPNYVNPQMYGNPQQPVNQQPANQQPVNQPNYVNPQMYGNQQQPGQSYAAQQPGQPYVAPQQPGQSYAAPQQPANQQPVNQTNYVNPQMYGNPQPGQPYAAPQQPGQPYGMPQGYPYGYNPATNGQTQSAQNKTKAIIAVSVGAFLVLVLAVIGIYSGVKAFGKKSPDKNDGAKIEVPVMDEDTKDEDTKEEDSDVEEASEEDFNWEDGPQLQTIEEPDLGELLGDDFFAEEEQVVNPNAEYPDDDPKNLFTVQIGNEFYHTPCSVAYYLERGWTIEDTEDDTLGYMETVYTNLFYNGNSRKYLSVHITNLDVNAHALEDCYVTQLALSEYTTEGLDVDIKTHNGDITILKSTREDVINALGDAYTYKDGADSDMITYFKYAIGDNYATGPDVTYFFNEDGLLRMIVFENEEEPGDFARSEVSDEVPEYLAKYKAPTSLGDDPLSGNFKLDGKVYNLPVPFSEFVDNGWEYDGDPDYVAGADQQYVIRFNKGDMTFVGIAYNPSEKATYMKYTMIVSVTARLDIYSYNDIEFPGGLSAEMTQDEVLAFLEKNNITNYEYHEGSSYIVPFDQSGQDRSQRNNQYAIYLDEGNIYWIDARSYGWLK